MEDRGMTLDEYQHGAMSTRMDTCDNQVYMISLLTEEVGEVAGKVSKAVRKDLLTFDENVAVWNGSGDSYAEWLEGVVLELGDVLWAVAGLASSFDVPLSRVASGNLEKLASRKRRGVIDGMGDDR